MMLAASLLFAVMTEAAPVPPIALHPENPHYLIWRDEPIILITSAEHYGAVLNKAFDFNLYLETLQKDGMNNTRLFSGTYREVPGDFGIEGNTLAPKAEDFLSPWARSDTPGNNDGLNKFDLTKWDPEYFQRLRAFLEKARECGIIVEVNLWCPNYNDGMWNLSPMKIDNNINDVGNCAMDKVYNSYEPDLLQVQLAATRKIVQEINDFDNFYFEICNEPYFGGVNVKWQYMIADEIVATEAELPNKHLISRNVDNGSSVVKYPDDKISIYNFHYSLPPDSVAMNYDLNRVIGDNETGFVGTHDAIYRREGWEFILAGGGLFNNLDYSFRVGHEDGSAKVKDGQPGGGGATLRKQLSILQQFMKSFDFIKMAPHNEVVVAAKHKDYDDTPTVRVLAEPGKQYAIYVHDGPQVDLELALPAGKYYMEWVDVLTGEAGKWKLVTTEGGNVSLLSPVFNEDIALRIISQ